MRKSPNRLAKKWQRIIRRTCLVIRIPNGLVPELCGLMECKHDHPRRIAMQFIRDGIARARTRKEPDRARKDD